MTTLSWDHLVGLFHQHTDDGVVPVYVRKSLNPRLYVCIRMQPAFYDVHGASAFFLPIVRQAQSSLRQKHARRARLSEKIDQV